MDGVRGTRDSARIYVLEGYVHSLPPSTPTLINKTLIPGVINEFLTTSDPAWSVD